MIASDSYIKILLSKRKDTSFFWRGKQALVSKTSNRNEIVEMLLEWSWVNSDTAYKDSQLPLLLVGLAGCERVMTMLLDCIGLSPDTVVRMG